jgi:hypothetical protein
VFFLYKMECFIYIYDNYFVFLDPELVKCGEDEFKCRKSNECINGSLACNDQKDCKDGSDEDDRCGKEIL